MMNLTALDTLLAKKKPAPNEVLELSAPLSTQPGGRWLGHAVGAWGWALCFLMGVTESEKEQHVQTRRRAVELERGMVR